MHLDGISSVHVLLDRVSHVHVRNMGASFLEREMEPGGRKVCNFENQKSEFAPVIYFLRSEASPASSHWFIPCGYGGRVCLGKIGTFNTPWGSLKIEKKKKGDRRSRVRTFFHL